MTRAPFVMAKSDGAWNRKTEVYDTTIGWRFVNKTLADRYYPFSMGETAENVAKQWNISREQQDQFAQLCARLGVPVQVIGVVDGDALQVTDVLS